MTTAEIILALTFRKAQKPGPDWLTITGGNPALYDLQDVAVSWQDDLGGKVAVETQGSKWHDWLSGVDMLTVSPKPPSSGMVMAATADSLRIFMAKAAAFGTPTCLKVVVFDEADYLFARRVHQQYPKPPFYLSCGTAMGGLSGEWVPSQRRPQGRPFVDTEGDLLARYRWLAERAMADPQMADVAVFPQLHSLTWGITTRGV
jgi:7-carboxy-7-deazaguanine synthase